MNEITLQDWEQKYQAAQLYILFGNVNYVAEKIGVSSRTIQNWKNSDWWPDLINEVRAMQKARKAKKMDEIIELSADILVDRLTHGDFVLNNKTGEIIRKPVSAKDAAQITNNLLTRQLQMEEMAERMSQRKVTVRETLDMLAKEFQKFTRIQNNNAIEVEFKEK